MSTWAAAARSWKLRLGVIASTAAPVPGFASWMEHQPLSRGCGRPEGLRHAHEEPRIRDNEQRTATNQALRGGPGAATNPRPLAREVKG